jgi:hypothetical protein
MSQAAYYQKHYARYDKFDNKIIRFKNREFYLSADFNTRANLKQWLALVSRTEAKAYVRQFLSMRKARKVLTFAPSQVELRTLPIPGMLYLNTLFGNYYLACQELGFKLKHTQLEFLLPAKRFTAQHHILCDTREQQPLVFPTLVRNYEALKFGDYRLNDDEFTDYCCIERKSLNDFYTTISSGYVRFIKEIERSQEAGFYLVVLVESSLESVYDFYTNVLKNMDVHISPEYVFHNMRQICQTYPTVQFLFVADRKEAAQAIERIFRSNGEYKQVDLQFLYDSKKLI